jgi:hypothetical protein
MEIILQWLDDLDDGVFAVVPAVERLRWPCLQIGLAAACGLVVVSFAEILAGLAPALVWVALGSLALWAIGITICELPRVAGAAVHRAASPNA